MTSQPLSLLHDQDTTEIGKLAMSAVKGVITEPLRRSGVLGDRHTLPPAGDGPAVLWDVRLGEELARDMICCCCCVAESVVLQNSLRRIASRCSIKACLVSGVMTSMSPLAATLICCRILMLCGLG